MIPVDTNVTVNKMSGMCVPFSHSFFNQMSTKCSNIGFYMDGVFYTDEENMSASYLSSPLESHPKRGKRSKIGMKTLTLIVCN